MHFFSIGMVQTKLSSQAARFHTFGQERLEGMHFFLWDFDTLLHHSLFVIFAANLQAKAKVGQQV